VRNNSFGVVISCGIVREEFFGYNIPDGGRETLSGRFYGNLVVDWF